MPTITRRQGLVLIGAAGVALAAPALAQGRKIRIGALRLTSHAASFAALTRGYFSDAGLDAELVFFDAAQPMAVAIASGDVDFGVTAITGGLISLAQRGAVTVFGGALQEEPGITGQKFLVSKAAFEAGVTAPKALGGHSFAISQAGSSFHYMGAKMAAAEGITLDYVPLQSVSNIIASLKSGQVDGWAIVPHIALGLARSGDVQIIGDVASYLPDYQVTTLFTSQKIAGQDRPLVEAFLAAFTRGVTDFNAALVDKTLGDEGAAEMVRIIHEHVYSDRPLEAAAGPIKAGSMRLTPGAALNTASLRDQIDWFKAENLVDQSVTYETVIDPSFVQSV